MSEESNELSIFNEKMLQLSKRYETKIGKKAIRQDELENKLNTLKEKKLKHTEYTEIYKSFRDSFKEFDFDTLKIFNKLIKDSSYLEADYVYNSLIFPLFPSRYICFELSHKELMKDSNFSESILKSISYMNRQGEYCKYLSFYERFHIYVVLNKKYIISDLLIGDIYRIGVKI